MEINRGGWQVRFYVSRWHANVGDGASGATGDSNRAGSSNRVDSNKSDGSNSIRLGRRNTPEGNRSGNSPVLRIC